jgi:hypothetical protein
MSEWWTYSLSDFLLFSPRAYYRLFELYNESIWPAHLVALALGLILIFARRNDGRVPAILIAAWVWTAFAFHLERYATINWAALYFAQAFVVQAGLILWTGLAHNRLNFEPPRSAADHAAGALLAFAIVGQPLIGLLLGRSWTATEVFAIAPDPTAVATLAVLVRAERVHWHLLAIPALWCAFTGLTLWTMEAPDALVTPLAAVLALGLAAWKRLAASPRAAP